MRSTCSYTVAVAFLVSFIPAVAFSQSVFLLQLGSYNDRGEAVEKWEAVRNQHPDLFKRLSLRVSEVTLPPDNYTIYRTQIGPLEYKAEAASLCKQLKEKNIECFVVETAMYSGAPKEQAERMAAEVVDLQEDSETSLEEDKYAPVIAPDVPAAENALEELQVTDNEAREEIMTEAADSSAIKESSRLAGTLRGVPPVGSSEGIAEIAQSKKKIKLPWLVEDEAEEEEVTPAGTAGDALEEKSDIEQIGLPVLPAPPAPLTLPTPTADKQKDIAVANSKKARLSGGIKKASDNSLAGWVEGKKKIVIPPVASKEKPKVAPPKSIMPPVPNSKTGSKTRSRLPWNPVDNRPDHGRTTDKAKVSVAEAIRVPLSQEAKGIEIEEEGELSPPEFRPRALGRGAYPSQNFHQRTMWAQLSYFNNNRAAINHWNAMRYDFPGYFDGVRGRVTRPLQSRYGAGKFSLRIGPFLTMEEVREICSLPLSRELRCSVVKDIGSSATVGQPRYRPYARAGRMLKPGRLASSRRSLHWVQLGSYVSPGQASREWESVKSSNEDLLGALQPDIYSPTRSSAPRNIFRLRTGPYVNRGMATELCNKLQWRGIDCLVVSGR